LTDVNPDDNGDDDVPPRDKNIENHGNGNVNFNGRDITNSNFNFNQAQHYDQLIDVQRVWKFPLNVRPRTLTIVGAISFVLTIVGTAASLFSITGGTIPWPLVAGIGKAFSFPSPWIQLSLIFICAFSLVLGGSLRRSRFENVGPIAFERDAAGLIWLTRLSAPCPRCDGTLEMHSRRHVPGCLMTCSNNPDHTWKFDYTTLDTIEPQDRSVASF
jgi:hypothetical protein